MLAGLGRGKDLGDVDRVLLGLGRIADRALENNQMGLPARAPPARSTSSLAAGSQWPA
jgi:hypothetical protein